VTNLSKQPHGRLGPKGWVRRKPILADDDRTRRQRADILDEARETPAICGSGSLPSAIVGNTACTASAT
jgi:hypothetical protein